MKRGGECEFMPNKTEFQKKGKENYFFIFFILVFFVLIILFLSYQNIQLTSLNSSIIGNKIAATTDLHVKLNNANIVFEISNDSTLSVVENKNSLINGKVTSIQESDCRCDCEKVCKEERKNENLVVIYQDGDGLSDKEEVEYGTDINNTDTDNDGYSDFEEVENGYNPLGLGKIFELGVVKVEILKNDQEKLINDSISISTSS